MRTPGEARYEWVRGKALRWCLPFGVLLLGFALLRRLEAGEAGAPENSSDREGSGMA